MNVLEEMQFRQMVAVLLSCPGRTLRITKEALEESVRDYEITTQKDVTGDIVYELKKIEKRNVLDIVNDTNLSDKEKIDEIKKHNEK